MNILKPKNKKVSVAFPDAPVKPVAMPRPARTQLTLEPSLWDFENT
jgi:hypothetical protein